MLNRISSSMDSNANFYKEMDGIDILLDYGLDWNRDRMILRRL
jgi:hypothetical protein